MPLLHPSPILGRSLHYPDLPHSGDSLALADLARELKAPLAIICASATEAQRLLEEMRWFAPELAIHFLPDWETLPYDHFSPHPDLVSDRLATLYQITRNACDVLIVAASTSLVRLPPQSFLAAHSFLLRKGQQLELTALRAQCTEAGYHYVSQVLSPGEFSIRGGLIDLFPMGSALPYRIDLYDNEIESIRTFDVDTQRSLYQVNEIRLLPAHEFPLDAEAISRFRQRFRERFEGDPSKCRLYKDVSSGIAAGGIEWYLPLFFEHTTTLFDYLPKDALLCLHGELDHAIESFWQETRSRHRLLDHDRERPILPPEHLLLTTEDFFSACKTFARIRVSTGATTLPDLSIERRANEPLCRLQNFLRECPERVLLVAESLGRREIMAQLLAEHDLYPRICNSWAEFLTATERLMLTVAPLQHGFSNNGITLISEAELYPAQVRQQRRREKDRARSAEGMLKDLAELHENDPVVHEQHGIGRYRGLVSIDFGEGKTEFLLLEYAPSTKHATPGKPSEPDRLYVPVANLHLVTRYSGGPPESAPWHQLGSSQWDKAKQRALKQIRDTAAELLNLYAMRAARQGHAFKLNLRDYEAFAANFPFEETPDQLAAIEAVIRDMQSGRPMDRLVCGDVGFGKTEVALRAAFVAVMGGRQVAVLVPTTLLAEQHYHTFTDRFAEWPVKIAEISRFRSAAEQKQVLAGLVAGKIDIIIGTHRLIQQDVKFKNLGLVIIDEEHRFGVRQKEQIKALRAEVDVLTLTATPIPRTLSMAMEGLRDFSAITTPPQKRLSIKTFVSPWSDGIIREAVMRELKRGGQVYFIHNEVESIYAMRDRLIKLLPEVRLGIAHGQLRERELEYVMRDFYHQRFNLLLCTTIIETGIDVPTANTIVIHRADRFGLAQLHQLRGRVGRSHHQAYAYLLTEPGVKVAVQAEKRLEAIQLLEDLGAGFHLAMHDLEIRGAGELLGESQSGEMQAIGFSLYLEMLAHAVRQLKAGKELDFAAPLGVTTEINLHNPALLPEDYCPDVHERLVIYKRLANCTSIDALSVMQEELIDRFGLLPPQTEALLQCHRLRIIAKPLGIVKIDASDTSMLVQFDPNSKLDPMKLVKLLQSQPHARMNGPNKLRLNVVKKDLRERATYIGDLLQALA